MKNLIILVLVISCFISCNKKEERYKINGTLSGQSDKKIVYLIMAPEKNDKSGKDFAKVDSAVIKDGKFIFEGSVKVPQRAAILLGGVFSPFYIENSNITFYSHVDSLGSPYVTGSKTDDEFRAYNKSLSVFDDQRIMLLEEFKKAENAKDEEKMKTLENQIREISSKKDEQRDKYIAANKSSAVALDLARYWFLIFPKGEQIDSLLNTFDKSLQESPAYYLASEWSEKLKSVSIGKKYPDFTAGDTTGKAIIISSIAKDKIFLIDFWQAKCIPCRREHPTLRLLYNKYHDKGFDILSVSFDERRETWVNAVKKDTMIWNNVNDLVGWNSPIRTLYAAGFTPQNYLMDRTGTIIARNIYGEELETFLADRFNAK